MTMDIQQTLKAYSDAQWDARSKCIKYLVSRLKELGNNATSVRYYPKYSIDCETMGRVTYWGHTRSGKINYVQMTDNENGYCDIKITSNVLRHNRKIEYHNMITDDLVEIAKHLSEEEIPHIEMWNGEDWVRITQ